MSEYRYVDGPPNSTELWDWDSTCGWYPAGKHDALTHAWFDQIDQIERGWLQVNAREREAADTAWTNIQNEAEITRDDAGYYIEIDAYRIGRGFATEKAARKYLRNIEVTCRTLHDGRGQLEVNGEDFGEGFDYT